MRKRRHGLYLVESEFKAVRDHAWTVGFPTWTYLYRCHLLHGTPARKDPPSPSLLKVILGPGREVNGSTKHRHNVLVCIPEFNEVKHCAHNLGLSIWDYLYWCNLGELSASSKRSGLRYPKERER